MSEVGMIEVTGVDLRDMLRAAYRLSSPQGLGFLHARDGELDDAMVEEIISRDDGNKWTAIGTDYVHGRAMKFSVRRYDGRLYIQRRWFDHSQAQLAELLSAVGLSPDLIDKAEAEWREHVERDVSFVLQHMKDSNGTIIERHADFDPFFAEHATGLYAAKDRGLVKDEYASGDRQTIWRLVEGPAP